MKLKLFARLAAAAAGVFMAVSATAQSTPISLIVGYGAGGAADFVCRVVGEEMSKKLGRQIIVENVAGASGMLAAQKVLNGPADGSIIYMGGTDTVLIPMLNNKVKLEWEKDLTPLARTTTVPMIFAVPSSSPYNSLTDLVSDLKKTGKENFAYAVPGIGTMQHLYGSLINRQAKIHLVHVPYRGGAQMATDLVGGQIDSAVLTLSTAMPFLKDGKIKALSMSDTVRSPAIPDVKRVGEEEGFAGLSLPLWQGWFVKAGTPPDVVAAYEKALLGAVNNADVQAKLKTSGIAPAPLNGKELGAFIKQQAGIYKEVVESARISLEE